MDIPPSRLSPETLRAIIEEFVTREGTDYGERVYSLEEKVEEVERQLRRGMAAISYDQQSGTCSIRRAGSPADSIESDTPEIGPEIGDEHEGSGE